MSRRPSDWWVLDLDGDPTPGDPFGIRELARRMATLAADAAEASGRVRQASGTEVVRSWVGESGDAYREEIGGFPNDLDKLSHSYGMAGRALTAYAGSLDAAQEQADRALAKGRDARARLDAAGAQLTTARTAESGAARALADVRDPSRTAAPVPAGGGPAPGPDPAAVATAVRNHNAAATRLSQAQGAVDAAQGDLDAARRLALAAKGLRESAEDTAAHALHAASHAGIHNKHWWQKAGHALAKGWHVLVQVAKVVVLVVGIVALVLGGPLAWVVFAAGLIVLTDTLVNYAQGKATLWDVALSALACIPMTKGLTSVQELARGLSLARSADTLLGAANTIRSGGAGLSLALKGLDGAELAGSIGDRFTTVVPGGTLKALHSGSADPATLKDLFDRDYGAVLEVNAERWAKGIPEFKNNCTRCVVATDSTLAGAPAGAMPVLRESAPTSDISRFFGARPTWVPSYDDIIEEMSSAGAGARGIVVGIRPEGGHVFNVIHDKNGVVFIDGQFGGFADLEDFDILRLLRTN